MNTRAKGNRAELKAQKQLEFDGYLVHRVKGSTKWNRNVDIFNLFDLFAIRKEPGEVRCKLIQVKSSKSATYGAFMVPYIKFKEEYGEAFDVEVWYLEKGRFAIKTL